MRPSIKHLAPIALALPLVLAAPLGLRPAPADAAQATGSITGTVSDVSTGRPLQGIVACAENVVKPPYSSLCATSGPDGEYSIDQLPSGSYTVRFRPSSGSRLDYLNQEYSAAADGSEATPVTVTAGSITASINAAMQEAGGIAGTVTDVLTSTALEGVNVCATPILAGGSRSCTQTGENGEYSLHALPAGQYRVSFEGDPSTYLTAYYHNAYQTEEATPVYVTAGAVTSGIDEALSEGGRIGGTVTDAATGTPVQGLTVCALANDRAEGCASTAADGTYTIAMLPPGAYHVEFQQTSGEHPYIREYYNGAYRETEASAVTVQLRTLTGNIDESVTRAGAISGTVSDATTDAPLANAEVCAIPTEPTFGDCARTEDKGHYTISGLQPGTYRVKFTSDPSLTSFYFTQYYDATESYEAAHLVTVEGNVTTPSINAKMVPAPAKPSGALPLHLSFLHLRTAALKMRCKSSSICHGKISLSAQLTRSRTVLHHSRRSHVKRTHSILLATARFAIAPQRTVTLRLKIDRNARQLLHHLRQHKLHVRVHGTGVIGHRLVVRR